MDFSPERQRQFKPQAQEKAAEALPLDDVRVQLALMGMLDADRHHAGELWVAENAAGDSYAKRYREYVEETERSGVTVDLADAAAMAQLFKDVTNPTIH